MRATVESLTTGEKTVLDAGAAVYATGYRPSDPTSLLGDLARYCRRDEEGHLAVERDYRVVTAPEVRAGIYLQGATEHTHGISSSLLSNTAVRVGEILGSILAERGPAPAGPCRGGNADGRSGDAARSGKPDAAWVRLCPAPAAASPAREDWA